MSLSTAAVSIPLTCGEFIQGLYQGVPCLVSCPIDWYHAAEVSLLEAGCWSLPAEAGKTTAAIQKALQILPIPPTGGAVDLFSPAPKERGYGTSTADISAGLYALSSACGQSFPPGMVAELAVSIEPSDSSFFPGLHLFDHRQGTIIKPLGEPPPFPLIILDPGGKINTRAFNQKDLLPLLEKLADRQEEIFELFLTGLKKREWQAVGKAATESALAHQEILFNPLLERAVELARETGALGVCRAHSGTIIGIIYPPEKEQIQDQLAIIRRQLPASVTCRPQRCVSGGPRYSLPENLRRHHESRNPHRADSTTG